MNMLPAPRKMARRIFHIAIDRGFPSPNRLGDASERIQHLFWCMAVDSFEQDRVGRAHHGPEDLQASLEQHQQQHRSNCLKFIEFVMANEQRLGQVLERGGSEAEIEEIRRFVSGIIEEQMEKHAENLCYMRPCLNRECFESIVLLYAQREILLKEQLEEILAYVRGLRSEHNA
jgi:hypothetical protein